MRGEPKQCILSLDIDLVSSEMELQGLKRELETEVAGGM